MPKRKLKMTKTAIAARRRYRKKKRVGGCAACKKKTRTYARGAQRAKGSKALMSVFKKGAGVSRRRRRRKKGAGFFEDVGSFISNAAQTVLPMLPMIL